MMCFLFRFLQLLNVPQSLLCAEFRLRDPENKKRAVMVTAPSLSNYINGECKNAAKIHVKFVVLMQ